MNLQNQGGTEEGAVSDQHQTVDHLVDSYAPPTPPATSDDQEPQGSVEGLGALVDVSLNNVNALGDGYCESTDQFEEVNEPRPPYLQDNLCKSLELDTKVETQQDFGSLEESGGNQYELIKDSGPADCAYQATEIHDASLTNESLIGPYLTSEILPESEIYARSDQDYEADENLFEDTRVMFLPEPKKNQDIIDRRIGTEESEKESVHGPYYNGGNGNNVPVLCITDSFSAVERKQCNQHIDDSMKPFESHPSPFISDASNPAIGIVKPETYPGAEVLFDDIGEKLTPEPNVNQIAIAERFEDGYVEVDHGFWTEEFGIKSDGEPSFTESGEHFPVVSDNDCFLERKESYQNVDDSKKPVELLTSFSLSDTPILASSCVKPETDFAAGPGQCTENVPVADVFWRDEVEKEAFSRNKTVEAQLHENICPEIKDFDALAVDSVENAFYSSEGRILAINSCVADTTITTSHQAAEILNSVSGQAPECVKVDDFSCNNSLMSHSYVEHTPGTELAHGIVYSEEGTKTFHTSDVDTKDEDFIVIVENVDIPTEVAGRNSDFQQEISSGIGSSPVIDCDLPSPASKIVDVDKREVQITILDVSMKKKLLLEEGRDMEESNVNSGETSDTDCEIEQDMGSEYLVKPFLYLVKMPKFDNFLVRERVRLAQLHVDEKSRLRDSFQSEIQKYKEDYHKDAAAIEAALSGARASKKEVKSRRTEIDNLRSILKKVKNTVAVQDIDARVANLEHIKEHETIPLNVKKRMIFDIWQLNQFREYLSSNLGDPYEVQQAMDNKDQIEGHLTVLKKELDVLINNVLKAEATAQVLEHKCKDKIKKLRVAQAHFAAANKVCEEAYKHMQSLKSDINEKNQQYLKYEVDASVANNYADKREIQALHNLCFNQVETTMEMWNKNPTFREEYVQCNMRSTLKRLGTFDSRSLGPYEKPVVLKRIDESGNLVEAVGEEDDEYNKLNEDALKVYDTKPSYYDIGAFSEHNVVNKEDLKEQRRLEEKSKALEALMRKKKIAEKTQMRAELRAQKEAEQKEKEKEKRLRKKERRKSTSSETSSDANNLEIETTETMDEYKIIKDNDAVSTATSGKRASPKASQSMKHQNKAKSIPPSLRNRGRKKLQRWLWVIMTCMVVILVFLVGSTGFFNSISNNGMHPAIP